MWSEGMTTEVLVASNELAPTQSHGLCRLIAAPGTQKPSNYWLTISLYYSNIDKIMFKRVCPMPSVTLIAYFYPNISGWLWSLESHEVITQRVSLAIFKIMGPRHIGLTTLTFQGYVTSSVTWPFDSPGAIIYRCCIVTESLSPAIFEIITARWIRLACMV